MGSVTLKAKQQHSYKKYPASSERLCVTCNFYVPDLRQFMRDEASVSEPRCAMLGLKSAPAYRVLPDHGCDAHDNSEYMARLERRAKEKE